MQIKSNLEIAEKIASSISNSSESIIELGGAIEITQDNTMVKSNCISLYDAGKSVVVDYSGQAVIDSDRIKNLGISFDELDVSIKRKWKN